jgi:hypothetical protein
MIVAHMMPLEECCSAMPITSLRKIKVRNYNGLTLASGQKKPRQWRG